MPPAYEPGAGPAPDIQQVYQQVVSGAPQQPPAQGPAAAPPQTAPAQYQPQPQYQQPAQSYQAPQPQPPPAQSYVPSAAPPEPPPTQTHTPAELGQTYTGPYPYGEEPWRLQQPGQPGQSGQSGQQQAGDPGQPQAAPDFLTYVSSKGLDLARFGGQGADPLAVADWLLDRAKSVEQLESQRPFLDFARRVSPYAAEIEQFLASRQAATAGGAVTSTPPAAASAAQPAAQKQGPPELSDVDRLIIQGLQEGTVKADSLLPEQKAKILAYQKYRADRAEEVVSKALLRDELPTLAKELGFLTKADVEALLVQQQQNGFTEAVNQKYERHWYATGPDGQVAVDPVTGQPRLTDWGVQFVRARDYFSKEVGIKDPYRLFEAVIRTVGEPPALGAQSATWPGANGNGRQPAAAQPQPVPVPAQTPQQTFVQAAQQAATQYPAYPIAQRGGAVGQPLLGTSPAELSAPDINEVARQLFGPGARMW